eukprot:811074_1
MSQSEEAVPFSESDNVGGNNKPNTQTQRTTVYLTTDKIIKSREEVTQRIWKTIISAALPLVCIVLMIDFIPYASYMELIAIVMICIFATNTLRLLLIIYRAKNMYRIHSFNKVLPNWTTMPVTYKIGEWKHQCIHSISELSAIKGGDTITSIVSMSENIWILCISMIIYKMSSISKHPDIDNLNLDDLLIMTGVFGLLLRSIWDLNPWSTVQKLIHYIGTICWFAVIVAHGYQTHWNYIFYILSGLAIVFFMLWTMISIKANKFDGENTKKINMYSKFMLVSELCMLWQGIIALEL